MARINELNRNYLVKSLTKEIKKAVKKLAPQPQTSSLYSKPL